MNSEVDSVITQTEVSKVMVKLRQGTVSLDWQTRVVVPQFKKADQRVC